MNAMTSRERLTATLQGKAVDRVPVSFYEIGGFKIDPADPDPYNIFNASSWHDLLELAMSKTDIIAMRSPGSRPVGKLYEQCIRHETCFSNGSRFELTRITAAGKELKMLVRRDPGILTDWVIEHMLKNEDDLRAYLKLPEAVFDEEWDVSEMMACESELGDRGIVMVDTPDPLCLAAQMFSMDTFVSIAFTEPVLFSALLEKFARCLYARTEFVSKTFPGRLWRIYGPEYATEPYLPPRLFREYVVKYTGPMIAAIKKHGGFVRLHSHGRIKNVLPMIVEMGVDALDPVEPPPQGDIELEQVRREYGKDLVLFGNIEIADIENLEPSDFRPVAARAIRQGTSGAGRGFVLMPTASPYGRIIKPNVLQNYRTMLELVYNT